MALTELTQQSVSEAGIAASLAANVNIIPEPSVYFQDFTFGGTMFDSAFGNVENLSGVGLGVADRAVDEMIRLAAEDRKKDDPALDTQELLDMSERQRAELQKISVGGVQLSLEEWDEIAEAMENPAFIDALDRELEAQGKSQAERADIIYLTRMGANIARKEARGEPLTNEERAVQQRLENDPVAQQRFQTGTENARRLSSSVSQADLTPESQVQRDVAAIDDDVEFVSARSSTLDDESLVGDNIAVREGMSVASSSDLGNSFEAGFSPAPEFNAQAAGDIQLAQIEPVQTSPNLTGPALA